MKYYLCEVDNAETDNSPSSDHAREAISKWGGDNIMTGGE
jgi:hypothetical protein